MSAILGFLLVIIVSILVIVFSVISGILRVLFGFGRKQRYQTGTAGDDYRNKSGKTSSSDSAENYTTQNQRKKIFDKDDGEYVDFEEVKDESKR